MKTFIEFLKRHSLIAGISLMFVLTWPIDFANAGLLPFKAPYIVSITFGWGISFASLIMTGLTLGKNEVIALLKRFLIWRVGWKWYLAAFLLYPTIFVSAVLINAGWTQTTIDFSEVLAYKIFGTSANLPAFILPFFIFDFFTNGEEMGWRGYVLPRLQTRYSVVGSSLIVGAIWAFWHLPRYLAPGHTNLFALLIVKVHADAVIYTWLYNNTHGSLLLTTILHAAGNTAGVFLPIANTQSGEHIDVYMMAIALLILTAIVVTITSAKRQSQAESVRVQSTALENH